MTKAEKHFYLQQKSEELYKQFLNDTTICGLRSLFKLNKIGSKTGEHIRKIIYEKYGKQFVDSISFHRTAKKGNVARNLVYKHHSEETKEKMKKSIKKSWENAEERREQNRRLMETYCLPKSQLKETKLSRIISRKTGLGWEPHSEETKSKMSDIFIEKWRNGDFDNRKPTLKSKGQLELIKELKEMGFIISDEFRIDTKPYDVYVKDRNLLIEFNGRYWHFDPRFYSESFYDESRKVYARDIWNKDKLKMELAVKNGYTTLVIWQDDWDSITDKKKYLKELIYGCS